MASDVPPATIFVVDDDKGLSQLIQKALGREGFSTAAAMSGAEAMSWLERNGPDLMLLDLKLKDMGGEALVNQLAEIHRSVPFIVITGQGDERVAVEMMKRGALDYLVKDAQFIEFVPTVVRRALTHITERKRLEKEVLEIGEREQRRIGQDLHDGLGQQLTAIELMCQSLRGDLASLRPDLGKQAAQVCQFLREAIRQTRSLAHGLAPFKVEDGLEAALIELARTTSEVARVKCSVQCASPILLKDKEIAVNLYRIAQEAVNNAVKHGEASEIAIQLFQANNGLRLEVADNGKGMSNRAQQAPGMGLHVMKYRADVIGAELTVGSKAGRGVTIICTLRRKE